MALPEVIEVESGDEPQGSVIWLHGLGADGHDFEPVVPELGLPVTLALRFVFPHAPVRPVTINGGMAMRAWFDIVSLDRHGPHDERGLRASVATLDALIEREIARGIPSEKIVLAGFSQGGAVATYAAMKYPASLAGLLALSTYLPLPAAVQQELKQDSGGQPRDLPVFMAHGTLDAVLPFALGQESRDVIAGVGFTVDWHEYPMAHAVCAEEIADIRQWLVAVYGA